MEDFVSSGRIADVILAFMAVEVAVMGYFLWRRGEGMGLLGYVASSLAGGSLVLALRAALTQSGWLFVAIYLLAGLLAHLAEIALRILMARDGSATPRNDVIREP
jgi:hypothetical protein